MEYFDQFPQILYTFDPDLQDFSSVKNIFARFKVIDPALQDSLTYYEYSMKDTDTPQSIAHKYYGDAKRHWIIYFANKILDPQFDFPLSQKDFDNLIVEKYGSIESAQSNVHHVERQETVTTTINGSSNTQVYISTATPYTYDFSLKQLQAQTFPDIDNPIVYLGTTAVVLDDTSLVVTDTNLVAVTNYDYEQNLNEAKRKIKLIDKQYVNQIENQLIALLSQ